MQENIVSVKNIYSIKIKMGKGMWHTRQVGRVAATETDLESMYIL